MRSPLSSEMKVLRLQQSKSRTSEPRELAILSTYRSLVSGSLFAIYLDAYISYFALRTSEDKITFWHSQKRVSKKIKATARNIFPGAPDPQVLYTFSFCTNWCPSSLENAPTGLIYICIILPSKIKYMYTINERKEI